MEQTINQNNKKLIRVITYSRVSTQKQTSTGVQAEIMQSEIEAEVRKEQEQLNASATKDKQRIIIDQVMEKGTAADHPDVFDPVTYMKLRPAFYSIYERALRKEFDELWVWNSSRFSRSDFTTILIKMFKKQGVKVIVLVGSNDRLGAAVEALMNAEFIEGLRELAKREHSFRLTKGLTVNRPPYGFQITKKHKLKPDKNAAQIRKMFMLASKGVKIPEICKEVFLYKRNPKTGRYYRINPNRSVVFYILKNPTYKGEVRYLEEKYQGSFTPLITPELWEQAQRGE